MDRLRARRRPLGVLAAAGLTVAIVAALVLPSAFGASSSPGKSAPAVTGSVPQFLARYMDADGRIVRRDQGGDTVSEGQAYAMMMTVAVGDRKDFMLIWSWTQSHLQLPDGLLAWRWSAGRVVGSEPASDADLGAAASLLRAGQVFSDPALEAAGRRLASAIARREVVGSAEGPTLVAGPWATGPTPYVDPSYLAPAELDQLAARLGAPWTAIAATADSELVSLTANGDLPSDWAVIGSDRLLHPAGPPGSDAGQPQFGFDAVRAPIWMGLSCDATVRAAAVGLLPALTRGHDEVDLDLGGNPAPGQSSALGLLAAAASTLAAGQRSSADALLSRAEAENRAHPTYYASAWVTLTILGFDHQLESCP